MLNIVACFKWVIDESDLRIASDSSTLDFARVGYKISDYDRNALEEAVRLREQYGGQVTAATVGPLEVESCLKDALSRGPDHGCLIADPAFVDLEPAQTSDILAAALRLDQAYDLIICGEGSSDLYAQQVGPRLGENLGLPVITYVNKLSLEGERLIAERRLEDGIEVVEVALPALVTVLPEINSPRIPGLKQVLAAGKKPVTRLNQKDLGEAFPPFIQTLSIQAAPSERLRLKYGSEEADLKKFVDALIRAGVVS